MMDEEPPEERYKALIGVGIAFSILIFIGSVVTIGVTKSKIASRDEQESTYPLTVADTSYTTISAEDEYYRTSALVLSEESDSLRQAILSNCKNCNDTKILLDHL